ncbi:DUF4998 domain-containing protein [Sphingobacterium oryzagri]|uniref:DUF4998 domain-containing protein n=1 Tax=Sphingobacterium oryzagri TaxID=3025669 RepID=A0ABY7WH02_9SPHI|nr:DUF4998 domain-containing protein [Sphingobacterium sp. KACC 22765]WDF67555.1 DUF4998 domain-containing protein [Sphingobacterium sp. KACC 22765]
MKRHTIWKLFAHAAWLLLLCGLSSCSKSDDYRKYLEGGEKIYTGKIDSVLVYSGRERVYVTGLFMADPKIVKLRAYWNNGQDSIEVPVTRTAGVDTLKLSIPVPEGVHNFYFVTYDADENASLKVFKTGISYGSRYISGLINKPFYTADYFAGDQNTTISWGGMDLTSGATFTEIEYTNTQGELVTQRDSIGFTESTLRNYMPGDPLRYRTVFIPDTLSIDTFYTNYASNISPRLAYLRNIDFPFQRNTWDNARWGTPAGWTVNTAAKNAGPGNSTYGGYELRNGVGVLSLEGGWGLPGVVNGKIYQTTNLQAGRYRITINAIDRGSSGTVYFAVSSGTSIPDQAGLASGTIAYVNCSGNGAKSLEFTLTEATQLTVGFVGNMPNTGSYFKVQGNIVFEVL